MSGPPLGSAGTLAQWWCFPTRVSPGSASVPSRVRANACQASPVTLGVARARAFGPFYARALGAKVEPGDRRWPEIGGRRVRWAEAPIPRPKRQPGDGKAACSKQQRLGVIWLKTCDGSDGLCCHQVDPSRRDSCGPVPCRNAARQSGRRGQLQSGGSAGRARRCSNIYAGAGPAEGRAGRGRQSRNQGPWGGNRRARIRRPRECDRCPRDGAQYAA